MCIEFVKVASEKELVPAMKKFKPGNMSVVYLERFTDRGGGKGFTFPDEMEKITEFVKKKLVDSPDTDVFVRQNQGLLKNK